MLRLDARFHASLKKLGQSLVLEIADHASQCNACSDGLQDAQQGVQQTLGFRQVNRVLGVPAVLMGQRGRRDDGAQACD